MKAPEVLRGYIGKTIDRVEYRDGKARVWFSDGSLLIFDWPSEV